MAEGNGSLPRDVVWSSCLAGVDVPQDFVYLACLDGWWRGGGSVGPSVCFPAISDVAAGLEVGVKGIEVCGVDGAGRGPVVGDVL